MNGRVLQRNVALGLRGGRAPQRWGDSRRVRRHAEFVHALKPTPLAVGRVWIGSTPAPSMLLPAAPLQGPNEPGHGLVARRLL